MADMEKNIPDEFDSMLDSFEGIEGVEDITIGNQETAIIYLDEADRISDGQAETKADTDEQIIEVSRQIKEEEMIIYLVTDRPVHGLVNYFRECGVLVSNIYTSIEDARNTILIQAKPCRIIVADTGLGKFTTTKIRQELIDMIGICDENNKVTVFYTDSVLKIDSMRELGDVKLNIDWYKYDGTASIVAAVLQYGEKYILDNAADSMDEQPLDGEIDEFNGLGSRLGLGDVIVLTGLSSDFLIENMLESDEGVLPKYEVNI